MSTEQRVVDIARVCHEANRALQVNQGDPDPSPSWENAPDWQKESAVEGVATALAGATPEDLHAAWCRHKYATGWVWGPVKDPIAKTHPCLVDYDRLPADQRDKDKVFRAIVTALAP